jgi:type I restriction enzyme S subunit
VSEWNICSVPDSLEKNGVGRQNQIPAKDIAEAGRFPVIDQGQTLIAGYCDDESKVIDFDLPLIIFGDHTRCFKFVDFPFVMGADGTKALRPNKDLYDPRFYYFAMLSLELPSRGYNRHFKALKERSLPLPPLREQKKIAHILSTVQRAIEAQERIIQTTTELKKALMHKLFTEGLRNEPQKQTEIGLVPESWEVIRCEGVCDTISVGIVVKPSSYYVKNGVPAFRSQNIREDRIQPEPMVYISEEANDGPVKKSKLSAGDVLIVRTGYPGTSCVVPPEYDGSNCIDLIFVRPNSEKLRSHYLSRFFNSDAAKLQVQAGKTGLAQQHFNVGAVKNAKIPLPPLDRQDEIVEHLELIDSKHDLATLKRSALQDLFRTLLHELMTAKTRVHELEVTA